MLFRSGLKSSKVLDGLLAAAVIFVVVGVSAVSHLKRKPSVPPAISWKRPADNETLIVSAGFTPLEGPVEELMFHLKSQDDETLLAAVSGLMIHGRSAAQALPLLRTKVRSKSEYLRDAIARLCGMVQDNYCIDLLSPLAHDENPAILKRIKFDDELGPPGCCAVRKIGDNGGSSCSC